MAYCIYHGADLDGYASAAVIRSRHPRIKMVPVDYGDELPLDEIFQEKYPVVFMVDFCPNDMSIMEQLIENCTVFVWIDHHVSSIQEFYEKGLDKKLHDGCAVQLDENHESYAACELAYMWMFSVDYEKIPYYFKLLGRFDVGDFSDPNTLPFHYGVKLWIDSPENNLSQWKKLLQNSAKDSETFENLIQKGKIIYEYKKRESQNIAEETVFELDFCGFKALAANVGFAGSQFFDSVYSSDRHDLLVTFVWVRKGWKLGFYSDKEEVDVRELAEFFGGGGHHNSGGALVNKLPDSIMDKLI